ncbi:hypothetical protein [sulfur-oxidizing endosymbiont of Gigantopelta aegis]|uniref:hypothetical protein n=1 Tax=sulfur-oxidizing endosymbiont of Gigantopelta aegis TaxID=2794934 RepID=UPI0018DD369F|nr:hypothetical protein [sulfur-oxidizing endosymbiont of Gigantopelta aegis]
MKYSSIGIIFLILINNTYAINLPSTSANLQRLKENIVALDHTREKSQKKRSQLNKISHNPLYKEYGVFIDYLSFRINADCEQITKQYGQKQIEYLPCELKQYQLDDNSYTTSEEARQGLEDELMQALGEFDEMLLEEEEMIAQTSSKRSSGQMGGDASSNGSGTSNANQGKSEQEREGSETAQNSNKESESSEMEGETKDTNSDSSHQKRESGRGYGKKSAKDNKRNKLDKIDDDIVARQLKEAAEAEKDPELKEKLWDEYYRYKQNTIK